MSTLKINSNGEVRLCCGGKGCPVLRKTEEQDRVKIKDDYGNEINISLEEAKLISEALDLDAK